jgi:hypothetical protein
LVEHTTENRGVVGSIPTLAILLLKRVGSALDEVYSWLFYRELRGSWREGLALYALTLMVEIVIGGGIRLLLALLCFAALSTVLDPGWLAPALAWLFAFGSVAWSLLGLARPTISSARIRASRPSLREPTEAEAAVLRKATRLPLWRGPARAWVDESDLEGREPTGLLQLGLRELLRLAGGSVGSRLMQPLWSTFEYQREFVADRYTVSLGEHWGLVTYFRDELDLVPNAPMRRLLTGMSNHPPAEERIERLENWSAYPRP